MKRLKTYFIYGFAFSLIVSIFQIAGVAILNGSLKEGIDQFTAVHFLLFWIGGMIVGFVRDKLKILNMD
ncbi:MAG: hypothetical protein AAGA77_09955 [Bacteroidota bacterium]